MSNQFTTELVRRLRDRYSVESVGMKTGEWMCRNTSVKGRPFSFAGYEFQREIADDLHPNLDVMKISQVGLTEIQSRKALAFLVRNSDVTGIFSLPNEVMYRRFSQSRLKPMIDANKVFRPPSNDSPVRSMDLMQFGTSFLNVVNASEGSATSTPADFVFTDEVDLSDQKILALFSSRLQNSEYRIKQRFSTPTWAGYGIDATYSVSDGREYFCKCSACNTYQVPLFSREYLRLPGLPDSLKLEEVDDDIFGGLDFANSYVKCIKCGAPLDLGADDRQWVSEYPSRVHNRGYRVRPFSTAKIGIQYIFEQLLDYKRKDFIRGWFNTVIGEPYSDARARLDEADIKSCMGTIGVPEIASGTPVGIGIDMGMVCHVVVGHEAPEGLRVLDWQAVPHAELPARVDEIKRKYNLVTGACDRFPYTPDAERLRDQSEGKIMPVEYRGRNELKPVKDLEDVVTHWQADRTKLLDTLAKMVRTGTIRFDGYGNQQSVIVSHLRDQIRDETPESPAKWIKLTGVDHYSHALAFLIAAFKLPGIAAALDNTDTRAVVFFGGLRLPQPA